MTPENILLERKKRLVKRMKDRGMSGIEIKHLPYLDFDPSEFATAHGVGARMIVLYLTAGVAQYPDQAQEVVKWLKSENLMDHVSQREMELFDGKVKEDRELGDFSWRIEAAYTLGWALQLYTDLDPPTKQTGEKQIANFQSLMPRLGTSLAPFLHNLILRDKSEIVEENIFNELATTYFRDLLFNGKDDTTDIDRRVSFERHQVLNWVRDFGENRDWDETDTST